MDLWKLFKRIRYVFRHHIIDVVTEWSMGSWKNAKVGGFPMDLAIFLYED